jgi:3-oxoacyl-[acyl-carrier protein] reductase
MIVELNYAAYLCTSTFPHKLVKFSRESKEWQVSKAYLCNMKIDLSGKRAMVCGSTQGIGLASARALADCGASVILVARDEKKLNESLHSLPVHGSQSHGILCADFDDPDTLRSKLEAAGLDRDPVHILVNNTGGPPGGPITEAGIGEFHDAMNRHLICNHILMQAVVPGMKSSSYGRIINIISTSVKQPLKGLGVSNTVRAAVANWAKTLAGELASYNITVNNVLPGATLTGRLTSIIDNKAAKADRSAEEVSRQMLAEIPAGRFAEPSEIGNAVAFLASPLAAYINGINVPVDGGRTGCL